MVWEWISPQWISTEPLVSKSMQDWKGPAGPGYGTSFRTILTTWRPTSTEGGVVRGTAAAPRLPMYLNLAEVTLTVPIPNRVRTPPTSMTGGP